MEAGGAVKPGVTTDKIDEIVHNGMFINISQVDSLNVILKVFISSSLVRVVILICMFLTL